MLKKYPQWAVVPSLAPWRGDMLRDASPYVLTGNMGWIGLNTAQSAARKLRSLGFPCHAELIQ